jgi:hypothetical protein
MLWELLLMHCQHQKQEQMHGTLGDMKSCKKCSRQCEIWLHLNGSAAKDDQVSSSCGGSNGCIQKVLFAKSAPLFEFLINS